VYNKISEILTTQKLKIGVSTLLLAVILGAVIATLSGEERSESGEFNRADVMFMDMMIVHHDQAIEMAELAENRTNNGNILELSNNISRAQKAENQQMTNWMRSLGFEPGNHRRMAGMASEQEMQQLKNSNGSEFNTLFAEMMTEHHEGGIEMAQHHYRAGRNPELKEMQQQMIETQQNEIEKMKKWQEENQL
jgi:uncharacterized protein (DUF305 family)